MVTCNDEQWAETHAKDRGQVESNSIPKQMKSALYVIPDGHQMF